MNYDYPSATKTSPRKVELLKGDDFKCALLGSLGFSTKLIMEHTDLTPAQVGYRLRKGGIRRMDYRNGESAVASALLHKARVIAVPTVKEHLRNVLENARLLNS
jgi:hypothetical protein